jgi:hypothetical protein
MKKRLIYFEFYPGVLFKGVVLKTRKYWFLGTQHLVLYRKDTVTPTHCDKHWITESLLIDRELID